MNQEQNNFNSNNLNMQVNNGVSNNQPLTNPTYNQLNGVNSQPMNQQAQMMNSYQQPMNQQSMPQQTFNPQISEKDKTNKKILLIIFLIILVAVISVIAIFFVFGNSQKNVNNINNNDVSDVGNNKQEEEDVVFYEKWGVTERWSASTESKISGYAINFPNYTGYTEGRSIVAEQLDGTIALISGQGSLSSEIDGLSNFFPTYFADLEFSISAYYGITSKNYEFQVDKSTPITIGEYDMYKFEGSFKFDMKKNSYHYQFITYATVLKENGAYAYWVVFDVSEDQSNGNLIAEHALNMAKTFREVE